MTMSNSFVNLFHHCRCGFRTIAIRKPFKSDSRLPFRKSPGKSVESIPENIVVSRPPIKEGKLPGGLLKPLLFTAGFSCSCFVGATVWQYERIRKHTQKLFNVDNWGVPDRRKAGQWRSQLNTFWNDLSMGNKTVATIIGLNGLVLCLWRVPRLQQVMINLFTSSPFGARIYSSMVLSTFSHYSFWHFGINMYVLHSFSQPLIDRFMGVEQFVAFYLSAGCISSLASYALKLTTATRGFSLGASGAILGLLVYTCAKFPESKLAIIFLPMFSFSAFHAVVGLLAFDSAGLLLGWKMFDHAAHLGGSLFGLWYATYGEEQLWNHRQWIVDRYEQLRYGQR